MGQNYESTDNHANNEIFCLSQQISDEAQQILNSIYDNNPFQSENIFSQNEDITDAITFSNNNLYFHSNNNNSETIYRRKHKFDVASGKLNVLVLKYAFEFIQRKIKYKYHALKKICYKEIRRPKIDFLQVFIYKTLGNIFSGSLSNKYTTINNKNAFNEEIIEKIKKHGGELKQILDIKFIDCFKHFMGIGKPIALLSDMTTFQDITIEDEIEKEYFIKISQDYEEEIKKRISRNR